jgi:hypothetical protein
MSSSTGFPLIGKGATAEEPENPFRLPSDDKIFRMREEEKKAKEAERAQNRTLHVWEKNKSDGQSRSGRLQDLIGKTHTTKMVDIKNQQESQAAKLVAPRRPEKENMTEFIAKKREMFLVQMSLDTKREEIRKLEEKAQMKEEALQRSEQMLEEDAMRFDAFLKENDKKAHDAIKKAEEETKRKQEKTQEIKRLTQQIQALSSEMSKHRESLEDCMRYKQFLDMLTPPEWFQKHAEEQARLKEAKRKASYDARKKEWEKTRRNIIDSYKKEFEARRAERKKDRKRAAEEEEKEKTEAELDIPPMPRLQDEVVQWVDADPPMYFTETKQLMDIFASLEEQNLFLIQNSQETEKTLEELRHAFKETKISMDARTGVLQTQIDDLEQHIGVEGERTKALSAQKTQGSGPGSAAGGSGSGAATHPDKSQHDKEKMLQDLNLKVRNVCQQCEIDVSSKPSTLFMLSALESKLEVLLADIEKMPVEYVIKIEKEKEKRRRERKREEQQQLQIRQQEERNKRAIERSMQAPKKRTGRQIMQRSRPVRKETTTTVDVGDEENTDEVKYLS